MGLLSIPVSVSNPLRPDDFDAFIIEELEGPKKTVRLTGNQMPMIPFEFGGSQRISKDYYPGFSEPVVQVLGPEEGNTTIKGVFKDKRLPSSVYGASTELQQLIDSIRIRGNLCRFVLGEWQRYGHLASTNFQMDKLSRVSYTIELAIIGFNAPKNARFLEKSRLIPFAINESLIAQAAALQRSTIPAFVPLDIADLINQLTGAIAGAISLLTGFVDAVISTVEDIKASVERAKGLIKHVNNKIREYKKVLGALEAFGAGQTLTRRYESAKYYSGSMANVNVIQGQLARFRSQFNDLVGKLPLARHFVRDGDTLQKIAVKFYGTADNWKELYDYNRLQTTVLTNGTLLEIPRL